MQTLGESVDPWSGFHRRWPSLGPPQRPHAEVCAAVATLVSGYASRVLLLGATPELADLGATTVAVDWSEGTLEHVWPGSARTRAAIRADWRRLPCATGSMSAAVGDGSFNCLEYPSSYRQLFTELARSLQPGGRAILRAYLTPAGCESIAALRELAMNGRVGSIHVLKWRLAMAMCAEQRDPNVPVQRIWRRFNDEFRDRRVLELSTGWSSDEIAQIDDYAELPDVFSFPTAVQVQRVVPSSFRNPRWVAAGRYELADRCPLFVMEARS